MLYQIFIYLAALLLISGCETTKGSPSFFDSISFMSSSEQDKGEEALAAGEYDSAITFFQQAVKKDPEDKDIRDLLDIAQTKAADAHVALAEAAEKKHDPRRVLAEYEQAYHYKKNPLHQKQLDTSRKHYEKLIVEVDTVITDLQNTDNWTATLKRAETLMLYRRSFPELKPAIDTARKQAGKQLIFEANQLLEQRKFTKALSLAQKASKLSQESTYNTYIKALKHLLNAREEANKSNFTEALMEAEQARALLPDNSSIETYCEELLENASGKLYNDGIKASHGGHYLESILAFEMLQKLNPDFTNIGQQLRQSRLNFSEQNRLEAERLKETEAARAAGRILMSYLIALRYDTRSYELEDAVAQARKVLSREVELRVSISFKNESREAGAGSYVRDRVLDGLRNSNISNLTVLEREAIDEILREQGMGQGFMDASTAPQVKKIRGIQTGVKGSVLQVSVRESGRERPSYGSVRYQSGTRFVPNPDYRQYQARVNSAQENVYRAQQALNAERANRQRNTYTYDSRKSSTINQLNLLNQTIADSSVSGAERDLDNAQTYLSEARYRLANAPSQIEEPVYANARYPIYNMRMDGDVKISFRLIDFSTSEIGRSHSIHITDHVSDRYIAGDPGKGIADDPNDLPPIQVFKEKLLNLAVDETITKLSAELARYSQQYLKKARRAEDHHIKDDAVEYYVRYLSSNSNDSGGESREAKQYIKAYYGVEVAP